MAKPDSRELTVFNKAGVITTNAAGVAYVVFTSALPYGFQYVVTLQCVDNGGAPAPVAIVYPKQLTQTGFTITAYSTKSEKLDVPLANITVYWVVRSMYNE